VLQAAHRKLRKHTVAWHFAFLMALLSAYALCIDGARGEASPSCAKLPILSSTERAGSVSSFCARVRVLLSVATPLVTPSVDEDRLPGWRAGSALSSKRERCAL